MLHALDGLRELTAASMLLRMLLAMICGGLIGIERARRHRAAGFRTYMLVCLGSALTILLGQYLYHLATHAWAAEAAAVGFRTDITRIGSKVVNGIGFLGAGVILVTGHQEVKGLTTAAGLWATACVGLAVGAGFYECVIVAFALIFLSMHLLRRVETMLMERGRNLNLYVEVQSLENFSDVLACIRAQGVHIHAVDIDRGRNGGNPNAIVYLRLNRGQHHTQIMTALSELESVSAVEI